MKITRKSAFTGKVHTMDIDITPEELARVEKRDELIQHIIPHIPAGQREFLNTGATPEEWDELFPEED